MTIRQTIEENLTECGLWSDEAKEISKILEKEYTPMQGRWDEDVSSCPKGVTALAWIAARRWAIDWLKDKKPNHFALQVLESLN